MDTRQILLLLCVGGAIFLLWGSVGRYKKERAFSNMINFVVGIPLLILGIWGFFSPWMDERRTGLLLFAGGAMLSLSESVDRYKRKEQRVNDMISLLCGSAVLIVAVWGIFFVDPA